MTNGCGRDPQPGRRDARPLARPGRRSPCRASLLFVNRPASPWRTVRPFTPQVKGRVYARSDSSTWPRSCRSATTGPDRSLSGGPRLVLLKGSAHTMGARGCGAGHSPSFRFGCVCGSCSVGQRLVASRRLRSLRAIRDRRQLRDRRTCAPGRRGRTRRHRRQHRRGARRRRSHRGARRVRRAERSRSSRRDILTSSLVVSSQRPTSQRRRLRTQQPMTRGEPDGNSPCTELLRTLTSAAARNRRSQPHARCAVRDGQPGVPGAFGVRVLR